MIWSVVLGLLTTVIWLLGVSGYPRWSAWLMIAGQVPYTVWDVVSRNYGFLILTPVSLAAGVLVLKRRTPSESGSSGLPARAGLSRRRRQRARGGTLPGPQGGPPMKMLSTAPALILGAVQALLALLVGLGLHLSAGQSGAILTVTAAAVALIAGLIAHKFSIGLVTAVVTAVVTLLVSFGVHGVSSGIVATLNAAIVAIAMLLAHIHLTQLGAIEAARGQRTFP